ncbi:MAG: DEAD/DEAH box helicase [Deltaproteobacteria bacterium]|nr:DEAD/DEAH box helicase [Deltaproteobacteria bacterium]
MSDPESAPASGFAALGLDSDLADALAALGYEEPTAIQRESIPPLLAGRDLLGQAATGTGKTAAFALPIVQRIVMSIPEPNRPRALVLVPTRELAMQVAEALHRYGRAKHATVLPIYGGQHIGQQLRALQRGAEVVVATPGRALDHIERGTLDLASVQLVVLDEADEMLDMGFADDLDAILKRTPQHRQTALFSATLPKRILAIAERHLRDPVRIAIAPARARAGEAPRVRQTAYVVARPHKHAALGRVLDMESPTSAIVFCRTRLEVDELAEAMNARGYRAEALHGGFAQEQRDRVMKRFRSGAADLLIATDVAARGLDIEHLSHVFNYDVPTEADAYVHRIGRTGRAGREGVAITFVEPREHRLLRNIQFATKHKIAVATLPTVNDLRNRRLELTRAALRDAVESGELDSFRKLVEDLASELDPLDVAAAAVKLAHQATHDEEGARADEQDIPTPRVHEPHERVPARGRGARDFAPRGDERAPQRRGSQRRDEGGRDPRAWDRVRLFINAGRAAGLRPADIVGAIANEAGVPGSAIGAIEITDGFSLVEVPADAAQVVIDALRGSKIRGKRVLVKRDGER